MVEEFDLLKTHVEDVVDHGPPAPGPGPDPVRDLVAVPELVQGHEAVVAEAADLAAVAQVAPNLEADQSLFPDPNHVHAQSQSLVNDQSPNLDLVHDPGPGHSQRTDLNPDLSQNQK